jgi:CRISPR/Cas system-associated endonuclease Cas3-HD
VWCALLHDVGKGVTRRYSKVNGWTFYNHEQESPALIKTIFERLKQPLGEELEYVMKLARLHMSPQNIANNTVTDSAVRRWCNEAGDDISDLITLCECDLTTKDSNKKQLFIDNFEKVRVMVESLKSRDFVRLFQPCISGDDIMKILGLRPGKLVGLLKGILKDAILDDLVPNEEEPLRELLIKEYDKYIKENN